jgi:hypothetical protein
MDLPANAVRGGEDVASIEEHAPVYSGTRAMSIC